MKNTVILTIPFSFKGKDFTPSIKVDLDDFCKTSQSMEALCHVVATENNIGNYSYEYEVLQSSELHFSDATGIAKNYLSNGKFNLAGYKKDLSNIEILNTLQNIAKEVMGIEKLEDHKTLQLALQKAFEAGKENIINTSKK